MSFILNQTNTDKPAQAGSRNPKNKKAQAGSLSTFFGYLRFRLTVSLDL